MLRRSFLASTAGAIAAPPVRARRRPNVIVILTDDQGYGDFSAHGNPVLQTPQLDALRAESVRLSNFHVAPMCTPTRAQLMTGCHALTNLAMNVSGGRALLRTDLPTMAELFAGEGYATGLFGKWHLGDTCPYRPEDRGFGESVWFPSSHIGSAPDHWNNDYFSDTYRHNGTARKYEGYCTDVFFEEAVKWIRARAAERQPFFAYIATNAPHTPLFVPEEHRRRYAGQPPAIASFFAMIANIDDHVGKLRAMLRETGLERDTLLVFLTDNGGTTGNGIHNAGMRGGKVTLWEGGHRVPCFLRWPAGGIGGGRDIGHLTQVQDLLPTLAELCGFAAPETEGISLAGLLRGQVRTLPERMLVVQFSRMNVGRPEWGDAAVLWKQWRYLPGEGLFDVSKDPGQTANVLSANRGIARRMMRHYDEWWRGVEPRLSSFLPTFLGLPGKDPVLLSCAEWADVSMDQSRAVRAGLNKNGVWHVQVPRSGRYMLSVARWPREAGLGLTEAAPPHTGECGSYPAGVALPIARAEVRAGGSSYSRDVAPGAREVSFEVDLPEGRATIQSFFYGGAGRELCGAYYVYASGSGGKS